MWIARTPNGPSVKCHVQNIHTMDELKMTGNCLKGSRGIVCFDGGWDQDEHWRLLKEMITHVSTPALQRHPILTTISQQTFSVPKTSRKLKPFIDHILTFSLLDNKIWFRNFQIVEKDPLKPSGPPQTSLVEIGPRFVLTPIRIFEGSFGGPTVFENPGTPTSSSCLYPLSDLSLGLQNSSPPPLHVHPSSESRARSTVDVKRCCRTRRRGLLSSRKIWERTSWRGIRCLPRCSGLGVDVHLWDLLCILFLFVECGVVYHLLHRPCPCRFIKDYPDHARADLTNRVMTSTCPM